MVKMEDYFKRAIDEIDAAIFSGDALFNREVNEEFKERLSRWERGRLEFVEQLDEIDSESEGVFEKPKSAFEKSVDFNIQKLVSSCETLRGFLEKGKITKDFYTEKVNLLGNEYIKLKKLIK